MMPPYKMRGNELDLITFVGRAQIYECVCRTTGTLFEIVDNSLAGQFGNLTSFILALVLC